MKVVHMMDSAGVYGAESFLNSLLPSLRQLGVSVAFACLSPLESNGTDLGRELEKNSIKVFFVNEKKKISLKGLCTIYKIQQMTGANILHVHGYKATILGAIVSLFAKLPILSTYHADANRYPELANYVKIETWFLKRSAHIIAVSNIIKRDLIIRGISSKKISVIYNGIRPCDIEKFDINATDMSSRVTILCVGRLISVKRFDLALHAFSLLNAKFKNLFLTIAGDGPERNSLLGLISELGLVDSVTMPGYVKDTSRLYREATIFLMSSETEGSPIALLEAMSHGLPIVATSVGAIPDMVTDGKEAILVPPNDLPMLADALRYLLSHPEKALELGRLAKCKFENFFNVQRVAEGYKRVYENILKG